MRKLTLIVAMVIGAWTYGQDIHFSQFQTQPMTQNPALVGVKFDFAANVNYKDQWRQIGSPYKTFGASADSKLNKHAIDRGFFAAGVNFFSDRAGDSKMGTTQGNFALAYHVKVAEHQTFGLGLMGGFAQRSLDYTHLTWGNQYDGTNYDGAITSGENFGASSFAHSDFAAGLVYNYNNKDGHINVTDNHDLKFNAGFSVYHLSRPKYSYLGANHRLYMKFVLHADALISIADTRYAFLPGVMIYYQGKAKELLVGGMFRIKLQQDSKYTGYKNGSAISIGGYLRARDAFTPMVLFEFHQFAMGVSYDVNISGLNQATNTRGGLELTLRFTNKNPFMDGKMKAVSRMK
jgi:type IX secretion system PorP/SprF family membrane protein